MAKITQLTLFILFTTLSSLLPCPACPTCPHPIPSPPPPPPKHHPQPCPPPPLSCPIDTLKLTSCVDILGGPIHIGVGLPAREACCPVLSGLVGLDAALCLCSAIKLKLLNVGLLIPVALEVLVDDCGKYVPAGFRCPV